MSGLQVLLVEICNLPSGPAIMPDTSEAAYEASLRRGLDCSRRKKDFDHEETLTHLGALALHLERMGRTDEAHLMREERERIIARVGARKAQERKEAEMSSGPEERRAAALEAYRTGDYGHAERLLRSLIVNRFEIPSTHCHLGRIMLIQDNVAEALMETSAALEHRAEASPYVIPRILWLQLALLYTWPAKAPGMDSAPVILGRLKTVLAREGAHAEWTMDPVLAHLQPRLPAERYQLLAALIAALSDATKVPALEQFPAWRDVQPQLLE
jgi:hypothetical protein